MQHMKATGLPSRLTVGVKAVSAPIQTVTFAKGFWMGKYPVTVAEFRAFVKERLVPLWTRFPGAQEVRVLDGMSRAGAVQIDSREVEATATSMVVVLTYWLSFEYVRDPRKALEPENAQAALLRGAQHVLNLLVPYLEPGQRQHLLGLTSAYDARPVAP